MTRVTARGEIVWTPPPDVRATTRIGAFLDWLASTRDLHFDGYHELWQWSVDDLDGFWGACHGMVGRAVARPAARSRSRDRAMPGAVWFPGGTLNYAEHALARGGRRGPTTSRSSPRGQTRDAERAHVGRARRRGGALPGRAACGSACSGRSRRRVPARTSPRRSSRSSPPPASARSGRRARRSSASARWSTASRRSSRSVLLAVDGYRYGEKVVDKRAEVAAIEAALPTLRHTVHVAVPRGGRRRLERRCSPSTGPLEFEPVPFDHPLYVLYSSGTTGLPEGDRARPRRHHRRAPQDARAAPRPRRRRPVLLVHHHRLDDVELPVSGLLVGRDHRAVRRRSRRTPTSARCGGSRPTPASTCSA